MSEEKKILLILGAFVVLLVSGLITNYHNKYDCPPEDFKIMTNGEQFWWIDQDGYENTLKEDSLQEVLNDAWSWYEYENRQRDLLQARKQVDFEDCKNE